MNNKPNYNKGSLRNKIISLLHVTTLITPRMYEIIGVKKSISNCVSKLSKDDVIEKINNGEMINIINISTYKDNFNKYFQYYIDEENLEYFDRFGKIDLNTAKIKQKKR